MRYLALALIALVFLTAIIAQVPNLLNYQGKLTDIDGVGLNGDYSITFEIWTQEEGGSLLWTEERTIAVTQGLFDVILGEVNPILLPFDEPYWIQITVGSETLAPRERLLTVPFVFRSKYVEDAGYIIESGLPEGTEDQTLRRGAITWETTDELLITSEGNIGINANPHESAILEIRAEGKGLLIPRMTEAQRNSISDPADALLIFNTTHNCIQIFDALNSRWESIYCMSKCKPDISAHPINEDVCAGDSASFAVIANCSDESYLTYRWQVDEGDGFFDISFVGEAPEYSDWNTSTLVINSVIADNNGFLYRCIIGGDRTPDAVSDVALLTVRIPPPPTTALQPYPTHVLAESFTALWNEIPEATGYFIDVSAESDFSSFVSGYEFLEMGDVTSFEVSGLIENQRYYYRVYASNDCGVSPASNIIDIYTSDCPLFLNVGDTCSGGVVAYTDYPSCECGLLIVSMEDMTETATVQWGCYGTLIGGTSSTIGTGAANTSAILAGCEEEGIAARLCDDYESGGFTDWFLPSRNELNTLYNNRDAINAGLSTYGGTPFASGYYWSSTEADAENARRRYLTGTLSYDNPKTQTSRVRAVRCFRAMD